MIAAAELPSGPRMRCEKYSAEISVSTCLARQRKAARAGSRWAYNGGEWDPGCVNCRQGMAARGEPMEGIAAGSRSHKEVQAMGRAARATVESKRCSVCGEVKAAAEYYMDLRLKDGLASRCKACSKQAALASQARRRAKDGIAAGSRSHKNDRADRKSRGGGSLQVRPAVAAPAAAGAVITVAVDCGPLVAAIDRLVERLTKEG